MSDVSKLSVEHSAVTNHVQSLDQHNQSLQEQSKRFLDVISPLEGSWKGSSVGSWQEMTEAWHESMSNVNQALEQLKSRVEGAGQAYQSGEEEQESTLQSRFAGMDMPQGTIL